MRAITYCFLLVTLLSAWNAVSAGEQDWTVNRVLQFLEAREAGNENLDVTMEVLESIPEGHKKYWEASYLSHKLMAESAGKPPGPRVPYDNIELRKGDPFRIRYYRDSKGLQRFDRLEASQGSPYHKVRSCVYDGSHWWTLVDNYATLDDGKIVPRDGRYLGFDFDWGAFGSNDVYPHSLAAALKELDARGFVQIPPSHKASETGLVPLLIRYPAGQKYVKAGEVLEVLHEHTLFFDPQLGMAPVRYSSRSVVKSGQEYIHSQNLGTLEGTWENLKEVSPGIWMPTLFSASYTRGVHFPKTGSSYPPGFDFMKARQNDYRVEEFVTSKTEARVIDLKSGHSLETETFKPDLPKDVTVYDDINGKVYQTPDLIPWTLQDDMRRALAASRKSGYGVWIWVVVANVVLLGGFGAWLWWRRRGAKKSLQQGAAVDPIS
jgi:hypothetical protein